MEMERERIIYRFAKYRSFIHLKERVDIILSEYKTAEFTSEINNVLELYNVQQYIENSNEEKEIESYTIQLKEIRKILGRYFAEITGENIEERIASLDYDYVVDFWQLVCYYKRIDSITVEKFAIYIDNNPSHLTAVLSQREAVVAFCDSIFAHLLSNINDVGIIISSLLEKKSGEERELYIEGIFSPHQLHTLLEAYVKSDKPHINMLRLIKISQNDKNIGLDDEIRLMAKRREQQISKEVFAKQPGFNYGVNVVFTETDEVKAYRMDGRISTLIYDIKWIKNNLDYPTILNNFIYLFEYTDILFRSNFPLRHSSEFSLADFLMVKGKKTYNVEYAYHMLVNTHSLQMFYYCDELKQENIDIENVIKWFFEEYLKSEFSVEGFIYNVSTSGTSYLEKCKNIASEMESVLKQYRLFCKYGAIDRDLLEMSSEHMVFSEIQSMQPKKYVYASSEKIKICMQLLFSNNLLTYTNDKKYTKYKNLYDILVNCDDVRMDEFELEMQQNDLKRLLDFGVLFEKDKVLQIEHNKAMILKSLYDKNVLCYNYYDECKATIDEMIATEDLSEENTLFSVPEQEYLNYMLNKAEFSDGLDLRNKYSHGTSPNNEQENLRDYIEFLKIMILIIIKINEEFCLSYPDDIS